jgi:hypothetical protein
MAKDVTGRDGYLITEALAFAYAAMRYLPVLHRQESTREDMRELLFAKLGAERAEYVIGEAMLKAWHVTHDVSALSHSPEEIYDSLRRIREQVMQERPDPDIPLLVRHIDRFLAAPMASLAGRHRLD